VWVRDIDAVVLEIIFTVAVAILPGLFLSRDKDVLVVQAVAVVSVLGLVPMTASSASVRPSLSSSGHMHRHCVVVVIGLVEV